MSQCKIKLGACSQKNNYIMKSFTKIPEILKRIQFAFFNIKITFSGLRFAKSLFIGTWIFTIVWKKILELSMQQFKSMLSTIWQMLSILFHSDKRLFNSDKRQIRIILMICVCYYMTHLRVMMNGHNIYLLYVESFWNDILAAYNVMINNCQITMSS